VKLLTGVIKDTTDWLVREFGSSVEYNDDMSIKRVLVCMRELACLVNVVISFLYFSFACLIIIIIINLLELGVGKSP
jgi:hypothetical protein